jgi:peptidyl-prolyl cis-trans isomerase B (cyclophilin B)
MVRSTTLDSASSQFYISLASLPILDGRFAVFGYVLEGMDLIEKLAPEDVILSAQIVGGAEYLVTHP